MQVQDNLLPEGFFRASVTSSFQGSYRVLKFAQQFPRLGKSLDEVWKMVKGLEICFSKLQLVLSK